MGIMLIWLYLDRKCSGFDGIYFQFKVWDFQFRDDGVVWVEGIKDFKEGIYFVVFYDGEDFWVVYQNIVEDDNFGEDCDFIKVVVFIGIIQGMCCF